MNIKRLLIFLFIVSAAICDAQVTSMNLKDGSITYGRDSRGNRVLDYSYCGYHNSDKAIPNVKNSVFISWKAGDNTKRIQKAIDYVSSLPIGKDGFRGTVLLDKGLFEISSSIRINSSGVVLRGTDKGKSVLFKKGVNRDAVVYVEGDNNIRMIDTIDIVSSYIPLNSMSFQISNSSKLRVGDRIKIHRPSTKEWIANINCDIFGGGISALGWKPGDADLLWDRTIVKIDGNTITIDAPLSMIIDGKWGKCKLATYEWKGRIHDSGVENITIQSDYDKKYPLDENHAWSGAYFNYAENCWVRKVNFINLAGSAVNLQSEASKVTVEDCISNEPISEVAGMRRCTFLTLGQLNLFQRCISRKGIHDFAAGYNAPGPNAFVQCEGEESLGFSGSIGSNSNGLLFDIVNIDGNNITIKNLGQNKNGAGWNSMNSTIWQCTASEIECYSPDLENINRAYGCWAQFSGNGEWKESNNHINPRSLFYNQLKERNNSDFSSYILPRNTNSTSSPTLEQAAAAVEESYIPRLTMSNWIDSIPFTASISSDAVKSVDLLKDKRDEIPQKKRVSIIDGHITIDGKLALGTRSEINWWNGGLRDRAVESAKPHITRFVPGMEGRGYTDRIDSVVNYMEKKGILSIDHNYGLWYERRRDDHERIRRRDADVWAPFYQQPFARSGQGSAWEGMSKYDLTRYDTWYWSRLKEFADKGSEKGLLLYHENYFQHNILEAGAHWVDAPWRDANNINNPGFMEPVNFSGDKRIFIADQFYDINNPKRRELHRNYIRQCLDNFKDNDNVIQFISAEFTGPLYFVNFWIDVIAEWKRETGKNPLIALSTTKDVQDAILNDPIRSKAVNIIDIRYWHYKIDGLYAPMGGKNLAPRQHARKMKVGKVDYEQVYKAVNEYREKYPDKAVIFNASDYPKMAWAILMAGGSCAELKLEDENLLNDLPKMSVISSNDDFDMIGNSDKGYLIYGKKAGNISINISKGKYRLYSIDKSSYRINVEVKSLQSDGNRSIAIPDASKVYWLKKI